MVTLVNFSHPLTEDAERILRADYGVDAIHTVAVQLDTARPLEPQLVAIVNEALVQPGILGSQENVDCIIPPVHPVAAGYMARRFATANIVVMTPAVAGLTPVGILRQFVPTELIRP